VSRITFSKLDRLEKCAGGHALPQVYSEGAAASRGSAIHAYLCNVSLGVADALTQVPEEHRAFCAALPPPDAGIPELAVAYNYETGAVRELGVNIGREYELQPGEIGGTLDLAKPDEVHDYKAGFLDVEGPETNLQLGAQALVWARLRGLSEVKATVRKITEAATFEDRTATLDVFALAEVERRIREIVRWCRRAEHVVRAGGVPDVSDGEHCRWCPARAACPAKVAALVQLRQPDGLAKRFEALLGEAPAEALALYERAEEAMKTIRAQIYAFARENPIRLADGHVFGPRSSTREGVDARSAWPVLLEVGGAELAAAACEVETSKAAIERALAAAGLGARKREVFDLLRRANAITSKTTETVTRHKPKETAQ
jgi:Protein of unknown function (DUF2800)